MPRLLLSLCLVIAVACGGKSKPAEPPKEDKRSLYERLGGLDAITAVVKEFVQVTKNDPRISMFFTIADEPRLERLMVEQICEGTGGPCKYSGKSMKESHTGMKVKPEDFEAFMDDLAKTLDGFKVPPREKAELLAAFRAMQQDVVTP